MIATPAPMALPPLLLPLALLRGMRARGRPLDPDGWIRVRCPHRREHRCGTRTGLSGRRTRAYLWGRGWGRHADGVDTLRACRGKSPRECMPRLRACRGMPPTHVPRGGIAARRRRRGGDSALRRRACALRTAGRSGARGAGQPREGARLAVGPTAGGRTPLTRRAGDAGQASPPAIHPNRVLRGGPGGPGDTGPASLPWKSRSAATLPRAEDRRGARAHEAGAATETGGRKGEGQGTWGER